jgi:hypothetical protein
MLCFLGVRLCIDLCYSVAKSSSGVPTNISSSMDRANLDQEAMDTYKYVFRILRVVVADVTSAVQSRYCSWA